MGKFNQLLAILLAGMVLLACSSNEQTATQTGTNVKDAAVLVKGQASVTDDVSAQNILQVALSSPDHTTLVAAVEAAGLVDVLANNGPLTVFAPTNAAFDALPAGTVEDLLKSENKKVLANIIKYHAAPGTYKGKLFKNGQQLYMAQGDNVAVAKAGEDVTVNGANILGTVEATNGVVHVVDAVLLPPE